MHMIKRTPEYSEERHRQSVEAGMRAGEYTKSLHLTAEQMAENAELMHKMARDMRKKKRQENTR